MDKIIALKYNPLDVIFVVKVKKWKLIFRLNVIRRLRVAWARSPDVAM